MRRHEECATDPEELLGAHVSAQGGLPTTPQRGVDIGATAIQVFTKTPSQWKEPVLDDEVVLAFRTELEASGLRAVVSHDSYLINLAEPNHCSHPECAFDFSQVQAATVSSRWDRSTTIFVAVV